MFKILTIKDTVRVPPTKFDLELDEAIKKSLQEQMEGTMDQNIGVFLVVIEAKAVGEGQIMPEDGAIFYPAEYKILVYNPELNEVVLGEVVDVTEFGAFTRIGPLDALTHVSQITDDKITYDGKNSMFSARKSDRKLKEGDVVRCRIVGVSLGKGRTKISLTMRQPHLGSLEWLTREKRKKLKDEGKEKK